MFSKRASTSSFSSSTSTLASTTTSSTSSTSTCTTAAATTARPERDYLSALGTMQATYGLGGGYTPTPDVRPRAGSKLSTSKSKTKTLAAFASPLSRSTTKSTRKEKDWETAYAAMSQSHGLVAGSGVYGQGAPVPTTNCPSWLQSN